MIFDKLGNMGELLKQAREMQSNLKKLKDELAHSRYEGEADGIKVIVNGDLEITDIQSTESINAKNIKEAVNRALRKAKEDASQKMKGLTGGMNIPGLT